MSLLYLLKQEWHYAAKSDKFRIILIIFFHSLSNSGLILFPLIFKGFIDALQNFQNPGIQEIFFWLGMFFVCFVIFEIFHRLARFLEYTAGSRIRENCVDHLYRHVYNLPLHWHQDNHSGDTINRVRLASESLFTFIQYQHTFIATILLSIGPFVSLLFIAPDAALLMGVLVAAALLINLRFDKTLIPIIRQKNEKTHAFTAVLYDFISNIETLITLGIGRQTERVLQQKSVAVSGGHKAENNFNQIKCQVMSIMGFAIEIGVLAYFTLTRLNLSGVFTISMVVQLHQYCVMLKNSTLTFSGNYFDLVKWATDFASVNKILDTPQARNEFSPQSRLDWQTLHIQKLTFHYNTPHTANTNCRRDIFKNFSIRINRGESMALTGASGSGKSTFFKLLRGLYTPRAVSLRIDSRTGYDLSALHNEVTLIPQLSDIFENTIRYNITLGSDISPAELEVVIRAAALDPVIKRLENGLDSDIREKGVNLSSGEKQRIALARGLLAAKQSSIILLDEITSNIDMQTEAFIYRQIFDIFSGRCVIASVHRLYLLKMFDRVCSLE